ncbi:small cysteine and glycine repeat-containing protein 2-like [Penaeus japonicus]|uniref:small cysteine and glycine repeat-containing protein 2-like n=1 Tax=Penaeus japonicus TaxID=27405 RepID=UPI001C7158A6|nr:small cysteine and glycine repeat-containing protein 2-like [Penaeus japonicus]
MKGLGVLICVLLAASCEGQGRTGGAHGGKGRGFIGGNPGGVHGGFPGGVPGGFPGGVPGGFPGGVPGGFPGGFPGGVPGGVPGSFPGQPAICRNWCLTPEKQAYCCETVFEPEGPVGTKPNNCPLVRPTCPETRFQVQPPINCSNDFKCAGFDKCCYDRCLKQHVCKPPSFYQQFG